MYCEMTQQAHLTFIITVTKIFFCWELLRSVFFIHFQICSIVLTIVTILYAAAAAKSLQSCPTLCDPIDCSLPGFSIHGILQARTLEWVAISFSDAWKWKLKVKSLSRIWLLATPCLQPTRLLHPWDFPGNSTGVGCHCPLPIWGIGWC